MLSVVRFYFSKEDVEYGFCFKFERGKTINVNHLFETNVFVKSTLAKNLSGRWSVPALLIPIFWYNFPRHCSVISRRHGCTFLKTWSLLFVVPLTQSMCWVKPFFKWSGKFKVVNMLFSPELYPHCSVALCWHLIGKCVLGRMFPTFWPGCEEFI